MVIIWYVIITFITMSLTWVTYVGGISLLRAWKKGELVKWTLPFFFVGIIWALLLDAILNVLLTIALVDVDLPLLLMSSFLKGGFKEFKRQLGYNLLVTGKLQRLRVDARWGWQQRAAMHICEDCLNPWDKGHC